MHSIFPSLKVFPLTDKELTLSQTTILDSSELKKFADDNFRLDKMVESCTKG